MQIQEGVSQTNLSYFIVVFGPPASGKTTLTYFIKSSFQQTFADKDQKHQLIVISADCCEQFLRIHSIEQLKQVITHEKGWDIVNNYKLKRSAFNQEVWKKSRDFIKTSLPKWLEKWKVIVLEDDMLLKSQRKQMRQLVENTQTRYLQIILDTSFQTCVKNSKMRDQGKQNYQILPIHVLKETFTKFQKELSDYSISWNIEDTMSWKVLTKNAKKVTINHPQLKVKEQVSQENAAKDLLQTKIRKFISQIISNQQKRQQYFKKKSAKEVAGLLSTFKKNYKEKYKSVEGFIAYMQHQISKTS